MSDGQVERLAHALYLYKYPDHAVDLKWPDSVVFADLWREEARRILGAIEMPDAPPDA